MINGDSLLYVQFFSLVCVASALTWGLLTYPMRIAPKASRFFCLANVAMLAGMNLYYLRSDDINYLHWYVADFIFLAGFCAIRWGGQHLFKRKLSYSHDLVITGLTISAMLIFPPQQTYGSTLMAIVSIGAALLFFSITRDNYQEMRRSLSRGYACLIALPFASICLFFVFRAIALIFFSHHAELVQALSTLNSPMIMWLYIVFLFSVNCIMTGNAVTRLVYKIHKLAKRDQLTGLWNRHALMQHLQYVDALWEREKQSYSVLLIDIDHFKQINDNHGHIAGDSAIIHIGNILTNSLRKVDFICRFGGEEFLVILPQSSPSKALHVAEKLQRKINATGLKWQENEIAVRVSIGYATVEHEMNAEQVIYIADHALYQAKQLGRNTICTSNFTTLQAEDNSHDVP